VSRFHGRDGSRCFPNLILGPFISGGTISVGLEGNWKRKIRTADSSERAEDFMFAYRIREVKVGRKGGIKSSKLYDKGALFDMEKKRKEQEQYEVEIEGMGDELDADDVEAESREVRQNGGDDEKDECVVVLPDALD
jgi:hypothetical protein